MSASNEVTPPVERTHRSIVVSGGPGAGKTTAVDLFRRELGPRVIPVPEAATMLFGGGFPRTKEPLAVRAAQRAVFHVQRSLESAQAARFPGRVLLCDRGTVDGAAYWPGPPEEFFAELGTTLEAELARYDEVIFFETAAVGGHAIENGNPVRTESLQEAVAVDRRLRALWSRHPHFDFVAHDRSFLAKIGGGLNALAGSLTRLSI